MKNTLFLSIILASALCSSAFAEAVLIPNSNDTTQIVDATLWRLIFTPGVETTYAGTLNLDREGGAWCGPANASKTETAPATTSSVIHLTGNLTGSTDVSLNEYNNSSAVANAIFTLSGTESTYSGVMMLGHGGNINNSYTQVTLEDGASLSAATIAFQNDRAHTILNVAGNATIGGLSTTQTGALLTSTNAENTLTLNVAEGKNLSYAGKIGDTTTTYFGATLETATTTNNSTALSITKSGTGSQTLSGAANLNVLTLNNGTLVFGADSSASALSVTAGTLTINSNKTLTVDTLTMTGGTINGAGTLAVGEDSTMHGSLSAAKINVAEEKTLTLDAQVNFSNNASITGAGTLKLTASGDFQYHANNALENFTGAVVVSGSTLQIGTNNTRLANASRITIEKGGIIKGWGGTFNRDILLNGGGIGDAGADEGFSGAITLEGADSFVRVNGGKTVTISGAISGTGTLNKQEGGTLTISGDATKSFGTLKVAAGTVNINSAVTLSGSLESGANTINITKDVTAGTYASTGSNGKINISNGATLSVSDSSSGQGVWIDAGAVLTVKDTSVISIADDTLTIGAVSGSDATISRLSNATAKLGVHKNSDAKPVFLKNVKVANAVVNYEGSDILYLGSMQGGTLSSTGNIEFAGVDSSIGTLTLNGNSITLGSMTQGSADYHENYTLTLNNLIVGENAGSTINANLEIADNGTLDFIAGQTLTMGCEVTLGSGVTVLVDGDMYQSLADHTEGVSLTLFEGVSDFSGPAAITVSDGTQSGVFFVNYEGGSLTIVPEPATATLSLLALAGLCARRKRH